MSVGSYITKKTFGIIQGRMNAKTLRRAKRKVTGLKIKNEYTDIKEAMRRAGVDSLEIYYIIKGEHVKVYTVPSIEINLDSLLVDSEYLVKMGFKLMKIRIDPKYYRIIDLEFQTDKVERYLKDRVNLFEGLQMAQRMEGKIK